MVESHGGTTVRHRSSLRPEPDNRASAELGAGVTAPVLESKLDGVSEMREYLSRELAQQPTRRIPNRLSDECTRANTAARTASQNLET